MKTELGSEPHPMLRRLGAYLRPSENGGYSLLPADLIRVGEKLSTTQNGDELFESIVLLLDFAAFLDAKGGDAGDVIRSVLLAPGIDRLQALAREHSQLASKSRKAAQSFAKQTARADKRQRNIEGLAAPRMLSVGLRNRKK